MQFRPLHDRVVVRRINAENKTAGGIIIRISQALEGRTRGAARSCCHVSSRATPPLSTIAVETAQSH